jgi:DNA-binding response OmpR family regulator
MRWAAASRAALMRDLRSERGRASETLLRVNERVLVIDDNPTVQELARTALEREGFRVLDAIEGAAGLELAGARQPAVVVLDLMLPDMPGEQILEELRRRSRVPVLILSAKADTEQRIHTLDLGADDFLSKPFSPRELVARVRALLRRAGGDVAARDLRSFEYGRLEIDAVRHEVRVDGTARELTPTEFDLLTMLAQYPGRAYSRGEIAYRLRGHDFVGDERLVDVHVRNLRRKIEDDAALPQRVETVRGVGYRLGVDPA